MTPNRIVTREQWLDARREHLFQEKAYTRLRDELSSKRRELPWVKVDKDYIFENQAGSESLADLFEGRHQLIVYHFMYGPDWEEGCPSCSFWADNYSETSFPSSEGPGLSVFYRDDDQSIYHTYSCYSRGLDMLNAAYHHMDLVPKGRDEADLPHSMTWLRRHDQY